MAVSTKNIYDPPTRTDGVRVLVTRYWPRGIRREQSNVYIPALAPSRELLRAFKDGAILWREFATQYRRAMRGADQRREVASLAELADSRSVTLMCTCRDEDRCHRSLLRKLVDAKMRPRARAK